MSCRPVLSQISMGLQEAFEALALGNKEKHHRTFLDLVRAISWI